MLDKVVAAGLSLQPVCLTPGMELGRVSLNCFDADLRTASSSVNLML